MKKVTGKWLINETKIRWFCRNCWQRGLAGIGLQPATSLSVSDIKRIIQTTCHTNCKEPDIRVNYDRSKTD